MRKKNLDFENKIVTTSTPLRISFIGGGTDMPYFFNKYSGITISSSIDKYIYVTVKIHKNFKDPSKSHNGNYGKDFIEVRGQIKKFIIDFIKTELI